MSQGCIILPGSALDDQAPPFVFSPQSTGRHRAVWVSKGCGHIKPKWRLRMDRIDRKKITTPDHTAAHGFGPHMSSELSPNGSSAGLLCLRYLVPLRPGAVAAATISAVTLKVAPLVSRVTFACMKVLDGWNRVRLERLARPSIEPPR